GDLEQGGLHVDDLAEDGGADPQGDVVAGDHGLLVAGHRELAHVHLCHPVDERHHDVHAGLADGLELPQPLHHPDTPLLDDLEHPAGQYHQGQDDHHDDDDEDHHQAGGNAGNHRTDLLPA